MVLLILVFTGLLLCGAVVYFFRNKRRLRLISNNNQATKISQEYIIRQGSFVRVKHIGVFGKPTEDNKISSKQDV